MKTCARVLFTLAQPATNRDGRLERFSRSRTKRQIARADRDRAMEKYGSSGRLAQEDRHQLRGTLPSQPDACLSSGVTATWRASPVWKARPVGNSGDLNTRQTTKICTVITTDRGLALLLTENACISSVFRESCTA